MSGGKEAPGVTKRQVIALHAAHPDWTAPRIAKALGCRDEYVRATARRNGLALPHERRGPSEASKRLRRAAPALLEALKKLTFMARTSGGTPGPDPDLMRACEAAEAAISRASGESQ